MAEASTARLPASALGRALVDFLLPRTCVACDNRVEASQASPICGVCWSRLPYLPLPQCQRCGHPLRAKACQWCDLLPPFIRAVRSVCWEVSSTVAQSVVHALKYDGWPAVAEGMAERMARLGWPADVIAERAAVIPVPLGVTRRRERGFNQSELLGEALAKRWGIPMWADVLTRGRNTATQTTLMPSDRLRNVAGAFGVDPRAASALRGTHVVLVDDVVTTAATLNACAAALFHGGARIVSYATFGRAPSASDQVSRIGG